VSAAKPTGERDGLTDGEMAALGALIAGDVGRTQALNHISQECRQFAPVEFKSEAHDVLSAELRRRGILAAPPPAPVSYPCECGHDVLAHSDDGPRECVHGWEHGALSGCQCKGFVAASTTPTGAPK